jgi:hypothetical protein
MYNNLWDYEHEASSWLYIRQRLVPCLPTYERATLYYSGKYVLGFAVRHMNAACAQLQVLHKLMSGPGANVA